MAAECATLERTSLDLISQGLETRLTSLAHGCVLTRPCLWPLLLHQEKESEACRDPWRAGMTEELPSPTAGQE